MNDLDLARYLVDEFGKQARNSAAHRHGKVEAVSAGAYSVRVQGRLLTGLSASAGTYNVGDWVTVARMAGGRQAFQIIGLSSFMGDSDV